MMSTAEAAVFLRRSEKYVRDLVRNGELPALRASAARQARVFVRYADLLSWIAARTIGSEERKPFPALPRDGGGRFAKP